MLAGNQDRPCYGKQGSFTIRDIEDDGDRISIDLLCVIAGISLRHGYPYMWIDRLCIWQKEDHEAPEDFDDEMSLLVQNALSNINDIIGQYTDDLGDNNVPRPDNPVGENATSQPSPGTPVTFIQEPSRFLRRSNVNALGSLVST